MKEIERITDIQDILLESLSYFDDFCHKNGIKYYLANGTLLGAAKYGKFIPWDDDADILMPREDYDRLMRLTDINNGKYRLLCREQFPSWRMPYAKLSCENTVIKEGEYDFGETFGLSVDIFPIDNWSPHYFMARLQALKSEMLKRYLVCSIGGDLKTEKRGIKKIILKIIWRLGKRLGYKRILKRIDRMTEGSQKRSNKYQGCICWTCHVDKEVLPRSVFDREESLNFCGREFPVFSGYKEYLDSLYGRWREELPPEKQHSNHVIRVWWKDE